MDARPTTTWSRPSSPASPSRTFASAAGKTGSSSAWRPPGGGSGAPEGVAGDRPGEGHPLPRRRQLHDRPCACGRPPPERRLPTRRFCQIVTTADGPRARVRVGPEQPIRVVVRAPGRVLQEHLRGRYRPRRRSRWWRTFASRCRRTSWPSCVDWKDFGSARARATPSPSSRSSSARPCTPPNFRFQLEDDRVVEAIMEEELPPVPEISGAAERLLRLRSPARAGRPDLPLTALLSLSPPPRSPLPIDPLLPEIVEQLRRRARWSSRRPRARARPPGCRWPCWRRAWPTRGRSSCCSRAGCPRGWRPAGWPRSWASGWARRWATRCASRRRPDRAPACAS